MVYSNGQGVQQDHAEAFFSKGAAEQGHANAQFNLGLMYANGQGLTQDYAEAASWYHKAAEQGDLDTVLIPEWKRLGIRTIGSRGFCALRLAQRLLDPVPAGNCKLQTLRQYYRLPERGAHTALGDVQTVGDLMGLVLRHIAERFGLQTWDRLSEYTKAEWFPSRIAFGKYKGRLIHEALEDSDLHGWLEWLTRSPNARSVRMGQWYLRHLEMASSQANNLIYAVPESESESKQNASPESGRTKLVIYINPELERFRQLVASGRTRLAELEGTFTKEKSRVDVIQSPLKNDANT